MPRLGVSYDFQSYAAGNKVYGSGRSFPHRGPNDPIGYRERDAVNRLKRNAMLRRLRKKQSGNFMDANVLGGRGM